MARYDIPALFKEIYAKVPENTRVIALAHCVGSIALNMAIAKGLVPRLDGLICNSVSIAPKVSLMSRTKMESLVGTGAISKIAEKGVLYPDSFQRAGIRNKIIGSVSTVMHQECDNPVCNMLSFMWGTGHPAIYKHENILDVTHNRLDTLFGPVPTSYFKHIIKMVRKGRILFSDESQKVDLKDKPTSAIYPVRSCYLRVVTTMYFQVPRKRPIDSCEVIRGIRFTWKRSKGTDIKTFSSAKVLKRM